MVNPYLDKYVDNKIVRYFSEEVDDKELIWHRDKKTRDVEVISGDGWQLQMDNELPEDLKKGKIYRIPKMEYHRVIKGTSQLVLKIKEYSDDDIQKNNGRGTQGCLS